MLYDAQTGRNDLLFTSTIDSLFSFDYLWLEAVGCSFFRLFHCFVFMAELVLCQEVVRFFHSLPKQMLTLDKIFMTVSNTTFFNKHCYNQHKMKVPLRFMLDITAVCCRVSINHKLVFECNK